MGRNKGSGGNILAIFAMIIAIGSLALSGYMYMSEEPPIDIESEDQTITEIWYDSRESGYILTTSYTTVTDLELTITVNAGKNVFIQFSGAFIIDPAVITTGGGVRLRIDEITIEGTDTGFYGDSSGLSHADSVTLQYVASGLSVGTHTINIQAWGGFGTATVENMNLLAYPFL